MAGYLLLDYLQSLFQEGSSFPPPRWSCPPSPFHISTKYSFPQEAAKSFPMSLCFSPAEASATAELGRERTDLSSWLSSDCLKITLINFVERRFYFAPMMGLLFVQISCMLYLGIFLERHVTRIR